VASATALSSSADRVHDLDAVAVREQAVAVRAAGHQLLVDLDGEALSGRGEIGTRSATVVPSGTSRDSPLTWTCIRGCSGDERGPNSTLNSRSYRQPRGRSAVSQWHEDLISIDEARTLDGLFARRVARSPDREAYRYFDRHTQNWVSLTWRDMARQVARWQRALERERLAPGDRVRHPAAQLPRLGHLRSGSAEPGLVVVPLYTDDRPDNIDFILQDAAVKLLLVQDAGRWKRLVPIMPRRRTPTCGACCCSTTQPRPLGSPATTSACAWSPIGCPRTAASFSERNGDPHQLASIVYTSGTTGRPKGVMLSHHNMLWVAHGSLTVIDCYQQDIFLSFLPLSHTFERTGGYYVPMMAGAAVAYARSVAQLGDDLAMVQPTVLVAVPRIFERVYGRIEDQMAQKPALARGLFDLAVRVAGNASCTSRAAVGSARSFSCGPLLDRLVAARSRPVWVAGCASR